MEAAVASPLKLDRAAAVFAPARRRSLLAVALDRLFEWQERAAQRRALLALDDRLLKDVGLTRADVEQEIRKPFWLP